MVDRGRVRQKFFAHFTENVFRWHGLFGHGLVEELVEPRGLDVGKKSSVFYADEIVGE